MVSLVQTTCLKSSYSLRRQLFLSFGISTVVTLLSVAILAIIIITSAGNTVKYATKEVMREQVNDSLRTTNQLFAETFGAFMTDVEETVQLLIEGVQDRIAGYPDEGWEDDQFVPFNDMETGRKQYPLNMPPPPLDWQIEANSITSDNADEHLQERASWFTAPFVSTAHASFHMQGICNPAETNVNSSVYYPGCSAANNNVTTGGVVHPSPTNEYLYKKSGDISVFMKPLFETCVDAITLGVFFHNSGAGASLLFPGQRMGASGGANVTTYPSVGCEWMRNINAKTGKPFATQYEIDRCHPEGTNVSLREWNPMESDMTKQIVLNSEKIIWYGPIQSWGEPAIIVGKSILDRKTQELLGVVAIAIPVNSLSRHMNTGLLTDASELALIRYDDHMVIAHTMNGHFNNTFFNVSSLGHISNDFYYQMRDELNFDGTWTPNKMQKTLESLTKPTEAGIMTAFPVPPPPEAYDPNYRPEYLLVHVISDDVYAVIVDLGERLDYDIARTCVVAALLAILGMIILLSIIWYFSRVLTEPLLWMESIAWHIINRNDQHISKVLTVPKAGKTLLRRCTPHTEIKDLVAEFRIMIKGFSGEGASKVADCGLYQVRNTLTWHSEFHQLYSRENKTKYSGRMSDSNQSSTGDDSRSKDRSAEAKLLPPLGSLANSNEPEQPRIVPPPVRKNRRSLLTADASTRVLAGANVGGMEAGKKIVTYRSSLFWWIGVLIVIPLLIINGFICVFVALKIRWKIPHMVEEGQNASFNLALTSLNITAETKARLLVSVANKPVRDLHLLSRVVNWLVFDAVPRSTAFISDEFPSEECKIYDDPTDAQENCPYYQSESRTPCPCEWEDAQATSCERLVDSRYLQHSGFAIQARDFDTETGERRSAESFLNSSQKLDGSPNATLWFNDYSDMPGVSKEAAASGYQTTYDRVRVASASAVVHMPVYNYATSLGRQKATLGTYSAFDMDGFFHGFNGCYYNFGILAYWKADSNTSVVPDLCPDGKHGFDPRCRSWYHEGFLQRWQRPVHVTAPYPFAVTNNVATTATSPILNPSTREYAGQVLLDYYPDMVSRAVRTFKGSLAIIITPDNSSGGDTVVGPWESSSWVSANVVDLIFQDENKSSENRINFENRILSKMKLGAKGLEFFTLSKNGTEERLAFAFAPVIARVLTPISTDNFTRGAAVSGILMYSIGVALNHDAMRQPFEEMHDNISQELHDLQVVNATLTVAITLAFVVFTWIISLYVTKPMLILLQIVQSINAGNIEDDIPPLQGGSREVHQVYSTFAKLYRVVRLSNTKFYSGNLDGAYNIITTALELFRRVDDQKAIGIACNNLGNILFAMKRRSWEDFSEPICDENNFNARAVSYYNEAIDIAQHRFQTVEDPAKADYALQLADRLFNRGLYLLLISGDGDAPIDSRQRAYSDIMRARDLDEDARDYWLEQKLLLHRSSDYYSRLLRRIRGLVDFYDDVGLRELWDVQGVINDADQLLFAAWKERDAPLFEEVTKVGRLQQLESVAIQLTLKMGNVREAAQLSMRMFAEDEFLLESSFAPASNALLSLLGNNESISLSKKTVSCMRNDVRGMLKKCKNVSLNTGKCVVFSFELSDRWEGEVLLEKINENCLKLYDHHCALCDYVGIVAYSSRECLSSGLGLKADNQGRQRSLLDLASTSTADRARPAFPSAVQMIVDSQASLENDSFIILVLDGYAWDSAVYSCVKSQIVSLDTSIHLFLIGLDVEEESVREQCKSLSEISRSSFYVDATSKTIDSIFQSISIAMAGKSTMYGLLEGITMEKF